MVALRRWRFSYPPGRQRWPRRLRWAALRGGQTFDRLFAVAGRVADDVDHVDHE